MQHISTNSVLENHSDLDYSKLKRERLSFLKFRKNSMYWGKRYKRYKTINLKKISHWMWWVSELPSGQPYPWEHIIYPNTSAAAPVIGHQPSSHLSPNLSPTVSTTKGATYPTYTHSEMWVYVLLSGQPWSLDPSQQGYIHASNHLLQPQWPGRRILPTLHPNIPLCISDQGSHMPHLKEEQPLES